MTEAIEYQGIEKAKKHDVICLRCNKKLKTISDDEFLKIMTDNEINLKDSELCACGRYGCQIAFS